jgi:hypothetical protein
MRRVIFSASIAAGLLAALLSLPVLAQGITNFDTIWLSGDLRVADDATVIDDLTTRDFIASQQTSITVTDGMTITPTGAYQRITSAAATGTSAIGGYSTAGRVIVLVNVGSNTITLTDTGTLKLSGNAALGQYDNITLMSDGANWVELSETNN